MSGWIKIHRQIINNPIWDDRPFSEGQAWIDLLLAVTFDRGSIRVKNGQRIELRRGECGYSNQTLANRWGWSRGKVTRFLKRLENEKMIQQKNVSNFNVIKVLNFEFFQNDTTNDTTNSTTNGQQTIQQTDTIKNDKNVKNGKNVSFYAQAREKKTDPILSESKKRFIDEYQRIFSVRPFLSFQDSVRISELSADYSDFSELIPIALKRLKNIDFKDIDFKPSASWLLKGNNFERVMNGEFKKTDNSVQSAIDAWIKGDTT